MRREYKRPVEREVGQEEGEDGGSGLGDSVLNGSQEFAGGRYSGVESGEGLVQGGVEEQESGGFQQQGRRRGKQGKGFRGQKGGSAGEGDQGGGGLAGRGVSGAFSSKGPGAGRVEAHSELLSGSGSREGTHGRFSSWNVGGKDLIGGGGSEESLASAYGNRFSVLSYFSPDGEDSSSGNFTRNSNNQPRYLKMLPNEDFDTEAYEVEKDWDGGRIWKTRTRHRNKLWRNGG